MYRTVKKWSALPTLEHLDLSPHIFAENPDVVVWVQGRVGSTSNRAAIRSAIGRHKWWPAKVKVTLLFFVGLPKDEITQHLVRYEFEQYQDIIQNNFLGEC